MQLQIQSSMGMQPAKLDQIKHLLYMHNILIDIWFQDSLETLV